MGGAYLPSLTIPAHLHRGYGVALRSVSAGETSNHGLSIASYSSGESPVNVSFVTSIASIQYARESSVDVLFITI